MRVLHTLLIAGTAACVGLSIGLLAATLQAGARTDQAVPTVRSDAHTLWSPAVASRPAGPTPEVAAASMGAGASGHQAVAVVLGRMLQHAARTGPSGQ